MPNEKLKAQLAEAQSNDNYLKQLTDEYQYFYFDICTEVENSNWCSSDLKYFDPRKIKAGDKLFDMMIKSVSVGEFGPGSYIVEFEGETQITGHYTFVRDNYMGDHFKFETETVGNQKCKISFVLGDGTIEQNEVLQQFKSNEGSAIIQIKEMTLMYLPQKPGVNSAIIDRVINED